MTSGTGSFSLMRRIKRDVIMTLRKSYSLKLLPYLSFMSTCLDLANILNMQT